MGIRYKGDITNALKDLSGKDNLIIWEKNLMNPKNTAMIIMRKLRMFYGMKIFEMQMLFN